MLAKLSVLALAALAPLVSAVGRAVVVNEGTDPIYVWSVGSEIAGPYELTQNGYYSEEFTKDPITGGKAFKITKTGDGLYTGAPQTIFAYSLDNDNVWYDLSDVFGDAFNGKKLVVASAETTCPSIIWPTGVPPAGSQVKECTSAQDVTLTIS